MQSAFKMSFVAALMTASIAFAGALHAESEEKKKGKQSSRGSSSRGEDVDLHGRPCL